MPSAKWTQPDSTTQDAATYKNALESAALIHQQVAGAFNVRETDTPGLSVTVEAGDLWTGSAIIEKSAQSIFEIPAPSTNPRIDIITINIATGNVFRTQGAEAASPVKPTISAGHVPLAYYQIGVGATAITNAMIVPVRSVPFGAVMKSGAQQMDGPLGVGGSEVYPWASGLRVIDVGVGANWSGGGNLSFLQVYNLYHDGTDFRYKTNGFAGYVVQNSAGELRFDTAPSGIAGAVATVTSRFAVTNDGTTTINGNTVWHAGAVIAGPNGTQALPAYSFSSDTAAGMRLTDGVLALQTGNGASDNTAATLQIGLPGIIYDGPATTLQGHELLRLVGNGVTAASIFHATGTDGNVNNTASRIRANTTSGRSINAGGTINASGADYAEYETKAASCGLVAKGDIVGFDSDGLIVDRWAGAVTFGIKSTNPSYVGGDAWGTPEALGIEMPIEPRRDAITIVGPIEPDYDSLSAEEADSARLAYQAAVADYEAAVAEEWQALTAAYEAQLAGVQIAVETARANVDRIAYSGKVPVNISGSANVGDYVVPVDDGQGGITAIAVSDVAITFEQYRRAIGQVKRLLPDGRPEVVVKKG